VSDQWSPDPGAFPPTPSSVPTGFQTQPGQLAPDGPPAFGSGPALPPSPPPQRRRPQQTTRNLLIAVSVLTVLLLVATVALVAVVRSDDGDLATATPPVTAATSTTRTPAGNPSTTAPSSSTPPSTVDPTPPGPAPTQEELDAEIAELSDFVERERGLEFLAPVEVTMANEATFDQLLFADFDAEAEARQGTARILKALGLVDADLDIDETLRRLLSGGVLGFYDPETDQLVIRGQAITPYIRQTLVHELVHALDDQNFELNRPEYDDLDDETSFGFSAVLEGNARRIDAAFVDAMSPADQGRRDTEEQEFAAATQPLLVGIPLILLKLLQAPYEHGQLFVDNLLDLGGQALLDAAIDEPATTSTQILHVERFLEGVGALPVDPPAADGEVLDDGIFGELMTQYTLEDSEDLSVATNAASGWAGDWFVTWEDGEDSTCIRIAYEMETAADLDELQDAYTSWAEPRGATVERIGDDRVEVTSCSATAAASSPL